MIPASTSGETSGEYSFPIQLREMHKTIVLADVKLGVAHVNICETIPCQSRDTATFNLLDEPAIYDWFCNIAYDD